MTSFRQIEANRRNALKSIGPRTEAGKQASRGNAVGHGLTAETVIGALEDAADLFASGMAAQYAAPIAVATTEVAAAERCRRAVIKLVVGAAMIGAIGSP